MIDSAWRHHTTIHYDFYPIAFRLILISFRPVWGKSPRYRPYLTEASPHYLTANNRQLFMWGHSYRPSFSLNFTEGGSVSQWPDISSLPQTNQPKKQWWQLEGGRAVCRPPAVFGSAYFNGWCDELGIVWNISGKICPFFRTPYPPPSRIRHTLSLPIVWGNWGN